MGDSLLLPYISYEEAKDLGGVQAANFMRWLLFRCGIGDGKKKSFRARVSLKSAAKELGIPLAALRERFLSVEFSGILERADEAEDNIFDIVLSASYIVKMYVEGREKAEQSRAHGRKYKGDAAFCEAWDAYPRKVGKKDAYAAFCHSIANGKEVSDIVTGTRNFALCCTSKGTPEKYIPYGSTFFAKERWQDFVVSTTAGSYEKDIENGFVPF